jgi:arginine utilization regulatory protein
MLSDNKLQGVELEYEALDCENQLLKNIIENIHESVFVINEKSIITLYNHETERIEGMKKEDVIGNNENEVYPNYVWSDEVTNKIKKTGKPIIEQPYKYTLPDGRNVDIIFSTFPFYYHGQIAAIYTIARNINQISEFIAYTLEIQKKSIKIDHTNAAYLLDDIIGISSKHRETIASARKVSGHNSPILIIGETGTGKELFAHGIHNASLYSKGPFIPVNCAAIPETLLESLLLGTVKGAFTGAADMPGLFEQAEGGTIFLDEINSMLSSLQAKLLRVLQDKVVRRIGSKFEVTINCRIISATNIDPFVAVQEHTIRPDLIFRLATVAINVPPLRERKEDIKVLTKHFIKKYNAKFGLFIKDISPELETLFQQYDWPGNIRELENIIESALNFVEIEEKVLVLNHLPEYFRLRLLNSIHNQYAIPNAKGTLRSILLDVEKNVIINTLQKNNGNITKTAEELGVLRQNLHYRIRRLKISLAPVHKPLL